MKHLVGETSSGPSIQGWTHEGLKATQHRLALGAILITSILGAMPAADAQAARLAILDTVAAPNDTSNFQDTHGSEMDYTVENKLEDPILREVCKTDCQTMNVKIDDKNVVTDESLASGIAYARTHDASVILIAYSSPEGSGPFPVINHEIAAATAQNIPVVMAAGNQASSSANRLGYDNQPYATLATSVNTAGTLMPYSNYGNVDMAVATSLGTSQSSAELAAVDLAIKVKKPELTPVEIEGLLKSTCDFSPLLAIDTHCILNVKRLFAEGLGVQPPRPLKQSYKTLIVEKKGPGTLSVKNKACKPKCIYKYNKNTSITIAATPANSKFKAIIPKQCKATGKNHRVTKGSATTCLLPTKTVKKLGNQDQKHFLVKFSAK